MLLRREGWTINRKRTRRIWRDEGANAVSAGGGDHLEAASIRGVHVDAALAFDLGEGAGHDSAPVPGARLERATFRV